MDFLVGGGAEFQGYELLAGALQSLLPAMEKMGIARAEEVNLPTLVSRMRDEVVASGGVAVSTAIIGAWSRNPAKH